MLTMATDYDRPRDTETMETAEADSLEQLRGQTATAVLDADDSNLLEDLELPGADLSSEELVVRVVPQQKDEFRCQRCFLLVHKSQRAAPDVDVCRDCA